MNSTDKNHGKMGHLCSTLCGAAMLREADKPFAVETLRNGRWEVHRFATEGRARAFRIAESRRTHINLSVTRLTKVKGGILTEVEGYERGTWNRVG